MTVLVTGAGGFLGSHVVAALRARGSSSRAPVRAMVRPGAPRAWLAGDGVEIAEADLCDDKSVRRALRGVDELVHCAARMGLWSRQNKEQRRVNVEGTAALYRASHDHRVKRIVHVSTTAAIGASREPTVLDESASWNLFPLAIEYVNSKHEGEERARSAAWAGMPIVIVNPGAMLGPRLSGKPPSSLVARIRDGRTRFVPPGGTTVCDVEDVALGCVAALERGRLGERYILGGYNVTWSELYAAIARTLGVRAPSFALPRLAVHALALGASALDRAGAARPPWTPELFRSWGWYTFVDSSKAKRELGYANRSLEETLRRACA